MIRLIDMPKGEYGEVCWIARLLTTDFSFLLNKEILKVADGIIKCNGRTYFLSANADYYIGCKRM